MGASMFGEPRKWGFCAPSSLVELRDLLYLLCASIATGWLRFAYESYTDESNQVWLYKVAYCWINQYPGLLMNLTYDWLVVAPWIVWRLWPGLPQLRQVHLLARSRQLPEGGKGVRFAYQTHYVLWLRTRDVDFCYCCCFVCSSPEKSTAIQTTSSEAVSWTFDWCIYI